MPIKPIDFGKVQAPVKKVSPGPAPIAFAPAPAKPPAVSRREALESQIKRQAEYNHQAKEAAELEFRINPITFQLEAMPAKPKVEAPIKPATFAPAPPKPVKAAAKAPAAAFGVGSHPACAQVIDEFRKQHPEIYKPNSLRIDACVAQLVPLTVEVVLDWAQRSMEKIRDIQQQATRIVKAFSDSDGAELCDRTMKALTNSGFFARFTDPLATRPALLVQQTSLQQWLPECNELRDDARRMHAKLVEHLAILNIAADVAGTSGDAELDRVIYQRRTVIQQSVLQAELAMNTMSQIRDQIIDQRTRIDQIINVTIPAYEAAKAGR